MVVDLFTRMRFSVVRVSPGHNACRHRLVAEVNVEDLGATAAVAAATAEFERKRGEKLFWLRRRLGDVTRLVSVVSIILAVQLQACMRIRMTK